MSQMVRVATHAVGFIAGILLGALMLTPSGTTIPERAVPLAPRSRGSRELPDSTPTAPRPRASAAALDEVQRELRVERVARANAEAERDAALAVRLRPSASLLDELAAIDAPAAWQMEDALREALREAKLRRVRDTWPAALGRPTESSAPTRADDAFMTFYAALTAPRGAEETMRLHSRFIAVFSTRIPELRQQLRDAEARGADDAERLRLTADLYREAEAVWASVRGQLSEEERTDLLRRGSEVIGYPPPLVRLALKWRELLGADVDPEEFRHPSVSHPFAWVYSVLERERSSEELRLLYDVLRDAAAGGSTEAATYECVKPFLTADEWRRLRHHPENGELPLSR